MNSEETSSTQYLSTICTSRFQSGTSTPSCLCPIPYSDPDSGKYIDGLLTSKNHLLRRCKNTIEDLNNELSKEHKCNMKLDRGISGIKHDLERCKGRIIEKDAKIDSLERINKRLNEELKIVKVNIQELSAQLNEVCKFNKEKISSKAIQDQNKKLLNMINERDREIKELLNIIEELEHSLEECKTKNNKITISLENTYKEIETQNNGIKKINDNIQSLICENKELKEKLEINKIKVEESEKKIMYNEVIMKELEDRDNKLEAELKKIKDLLNIKISECEIKDNNIIKLKDEIEESKTQIDAQKVNIEEIRKLNTENRKLNEIYNDINEKHKNDEKNIEDYKRAIESLNKIKDGTMKELVTAKLKNEELQNRINVLYFNQQELQNSDSVEKLQIELEKEQYKYSDMEKQCKDQIMQLTNTIDQERTDFNSTLDNYEQKLKEIEIKHKMEIYNYKQVIDKKNRELLNANSKIKVQTDKVTVNNEQENFNIDNLTKTKGLLVTFNQTQRNPQTLRRVRIL